MAKRRSLHGTGQAALAAAGAVAELPTVPDLASEPPPGAPAPVLDQPPSEPAWTVEPASPAAEPAPPEAERARTIARTPAPPAKSERVSHARREVAAPRGARRPAASPAATPAWLSGAFYEEMASFADTRLRHVLAAGEALGRCKRPAEVLATQADYARTAFQDYFAQSLRLMGLATGLMDSKSRAREA